MVERAAHNRLVLGSIPRGPTQMAEKVQIQNVTVSKETESALLVNIEGEEIWIPKSQIDDDSEVYKKDTEGTLVITEWIAKQKGLV